MPIAHIVVQQRRGADERQAKDKERLYRRHSAVAVHYRLQHLVISGRLLHHRDTHDF
jgi:hypothetical protein